MKNLLCILLWLLLAVLDLCGQGFTWNDPAWIRHAPASGSSGNAFTWVQEKSNGGAGATGVTMNGNVTAGNLLVVLIKWEGTGSITAMGINGQSFTAGTKTDHGSGEPHAQFWYILSATGGATAITNATSGTVTFSRNLAMEFSATGSHALDAQGAAASGTSTSLVSGSASSSVSTGLAIGGYGEYTSSAITSMQIGGVAATGSLIYNSTDTAMWYRLFTSTLSSATATGTTPNNRWCAPFIIFKST